MATTSSPDEPKPKRSWKNAPHSGMVIAVSASISAAVNIFDGFHIVSSFAGRPFFFAAPKGERSIIDELDATIDRIN